MKSVEMVLETRVGIAIQVVNEQWMLAESVNNRRETDTINETGINETGPPGVNDLNQHSTNIY